MEKRSSASTHVFVAGIRSGRPPSQFQAGSRRARRNANGDKSPGSRAGGISRRPSVSAAPGMSRSQWTLSRFTSRCGWALKSFVEAVGHLTAPRIRAIVTISATTAFMAKWLVPRVSRFQAMHPDIDLRLHRQTIRSTLVRAMLISPSGMGVGRIQLDRSMPLIADRFAPVVNAHLGLRFTARAAENSVDPFRMRRNPDVPAHPTWPSWFQAAGIAETDPASVLRFSKKPCNSSRRGRPRRRASQVSRMLRASWIGDFSRSNRLGPDSRG